jgi:glycosyltransferase involved in cell wall biosynthesis
MRIVVASTCVPLIQGGGTKIVDDLVAELTAAGHQVDKVLVPFCSDWRFIADQTLALRLLDLTEAGGERVDRLITIRYPSYALAHPNKVAWFIHHHRGAYDLWNTCWRDIPDSPEGRRAREMMMRSDRLYLREARRLFTNSQVVAGRLMTYNGIAADGVLYPPLPRDHALRPGPFGDYVLYVSRLSPIKRQTLAIRALRHCSPEVRLVLAGAPDVPAYLDTLHALARECGVEARVRFTGWVSEAQKADLLAGCCAALYLPQDEDSYGYSTLEALHAGKPVITLTDSGGPLELLEDGENGLVAEPTPEALAQAMDRLWADRARAARLGKAAAQTPRRRGITWQHVVDSLTQ